MNQKVADDRGIKLVFLKICTHQFGDLTPRLPFFSMDQFAVYIRIFSLLIQASTPLLITKKMLMTWV